MKRTEVITAFGWREADQQQTGIAGETQLLQLAGRLRAPNPKIAIHTTVFSIKRLILIFRVNFEHNLKIP